MIKIYITIASKFSRKRPRPMTAAAVAEPATTNSILLYTALTALPGLSPCEPQAIKKISLEHATKTGKAYAQLTHSNRREGGGGARTIDHVDTYIVEW